MINLAGKKFGRLDVICQAPKIGPHAMWQCRCVCGTTKNIRGSHLTAGAIVSCGCKVREFLGSGMANKTHGKSKTKESSIWQGMRDRCLNKNNNAYPRYGGRGISICERWDYFENFLEDMGPAPENGSIERVDVNGSYSPENCIWIAKNYQARNTRKTVRVMINGEEKPLVKIAEEETIPYKRLYYFFNKHSQDIEKAIDCAKEKGVNGAKKTSVWIEWDGKHYYLKEFCRIMSLNWGRFHRCYRRNGMSLEEAISASRQNNY